jgi:hypothetical protein
MALGSQKNRRHIRSAPAMRRGRRNLPKDPREMRLVRESASDGDLAQGLVRSQHVAHRAFDSSPKNVSMWRLVETMFENPREMTAA